MEIKSTERIEARQKEILAACAKLYDRKAFRDITLKEISEATSMTRSSIYNYFQTKEEIFLALLAEEYDEWSAALRALAEGAPAGGRDALADNIAQTLAPRSRMLKLLSLDLSALERNSRLDCLISFKRSYKGTLDALDVALRAFVPQMDAAAREGFLYAFGPFLYGVYPYTNVDAQQREAMERAGISYHYYTIAELTRQAVVRLLGTF